MVDELTIAEAAAFPAWPGWTTTRRIGGGSFGAVYEIEREVFGTTEKAALKVISIPKSESDVRELLIDGYSAEAIAKRYRSDLETVVREYSLMASMKGNTNVVDCDDLKYYPHENGYGWDIMIKMELLTPLTDVLPTNIPEEQVIQIGLDLCNALSLCQARSIVHRDIKPQNIMVSGDKRYKLGDFGIAKVADHATVGTMAGTVKYMAPEVYNGKEYGAGADIYSLGMVLYWMLNERRVAFLPLPPHEVTADLETEAKNKRFRGEAIPWPANGSEMLKQIVCKACAFRPEDRYQDANEMMHALQLAMDQLKGPVPVLEPPPVIEGPASDPKLSRTITKRKKGTILVICVVIALAVLGVVLGIVLRSSGEESSLAKPTERRMMSDASQLLKDAEIPGGIARLIVLSEMESEKFHMYRATCQVIVMNAGKATAYELNLIYEVEDKEWVLSDQSQLNDSD